MGRRHSGVASLEGLAADVMTAAGELTRDWLARDRKGMVALVQRLAALAATAARGAPTRDPEPACGPGCPHCCHWSPVLVTTLEVFAVVAVAKPVESRATPPCLLLDAQGSCGVHEQRPLTCRGFGSTDLAACLWRAERGHGPVPVPEAAYLMHDAAQAGLARALMEAGLDPGPVDLQRAAPLALANSNLAQGFLAGEPIADRLGGRLPWSGAIAES